MKFTKLNNKSDENFFTEFKSWLQSDLSLVNKTIFENLNNDSTLISDLSNHIINAGGKENKTIIILTVAKLCKYSGKDINLASVIEFIHTATLLHDDVVDNSTKRRGEKTANVVWGNKSSILVGDFLLSKAFKILVTDGSLKCIDIISKASEKFLMRSQTINERRKSKSWRN